MLLDAFSFRKPGDKEGSFFKAFVSDLGQSFELSQQESCVSLKKTSCCVSFANGRQLFACFGHFSSNVLRPNETR